jgi:hypothetical protein
MDAVTGSANRAERRQELHHDIESIKAGRTFLQHHRIGGIESKNVRGYLTLLGKRTGPAGKVDFLLPSSCEVAMLNATGLSRLTQSACS